MHVVVVQHVEREGSGAVPLASSRQTEHQAFRSGEAVWGTLFHMEMRAPEVLAMVDTFAEDLASAGVTRDDIVGSVAERAAGIASIAARVYGAWADRVRSCRRS